MSISIDYICQEIEKQVYEISLHADDERISEGLTIYQIEYAILNSKVLERYPDDPRGESCLLLGFTPEGIPIHVVCGKKVFRSFNSYNNLCADHAKMERFKY